MPSPDFDPIVGLCRLVSRQYRFEVLFQLDAGGRQRFSELQRRLNVSSKVLTDALTDLTEANAAVRDVRSESPPHVEYALTDAGSELLAIVDDLDHWATTHRWRTPSSVAIVDDLQLCNDLYAEWLSQQYDVTQVTDLRRLDASRFDDADVVVFHYRGHDRGSQASRLLADTERRCIAVTPTLHDETDLAVRPNAHLVEPVLKETLQNCVASVLDDSSSTDS